jgi:hypothetical protein
VLDAGEQGAADLVERVVLVAAPLQSLLLDPAADLVECLAGELDDMKGVQHGDRVGQLVADRVGIAPEGVQGGVFDSHGDLDALLGQPVGVDLSRPGPWTASRSRACRQPCSSRVRSTITVTALSLLAVFEGRQLGRPGAR